MIWPSVRVSGCGALALAIRRCLFGTGYLTLALWGWLVGSGSPARRLAALWRWRKVEGAASVAGLAIVLAAAGVVYDFLPALMA